MVISRGRRRSEAEAVPDDFGQFAAAMYNNLVGPDGHRFLQKINTLADGSPTRFPRILSYGLANQMTMNKTNYWRRDIDDVAADRQAPL